jgi:3-deoxy-D-manno-octulosonic-acid transferase
VRERLPATLRLYRAATAAVTPFTGLWLKRRLRRGKEDAARLSERYGEGKLARPAGPLVWIHGASVGELNTVLPLIERIRRSSVGVLVTTGTLTSAGIAAKRLAPDVIHQFVPLDTPRFVGRFLDHWRPDLALFVESDLWPNMILEASGRGVPLILINGRLSESSFMRWRSFPRTIGALLHRFDLCLVRTPTDAQRFDTLGAPRLSTTGNLKLDVRAPPVDERMLADARSAIGDRPIIGAASTHAGEEALVIEAHRHLRQSFPGLITLVAPRHPHRGPSIAGMAAAQGLKTRLRSRGEALDNTTDIYVADTVGELGLLYRLAPIVFIGGSLVKHGGQNPIEAAKLGSAIVHGPHVWNFTDIYAALDMAHGAATVTDAGKLALRIGEWLGDPAARTRVADTARSTVEALGGAFERTASALEPYLMQLRFEYRQREQEQHA